MRRFVLYLAVSMMSVAVLTGCGQEDSGKKSDAEARAEKDVENEVDDEDYDEANETDETSASLPEGFMIVDGNVGEPGDGQFLLQDILGEEDICILNMPTGYDFYSKLTPKTTYYCLVNDANPDATLIIRPDMINTIPLAFILEGELPKEDVFPNYDCEYIEDELGDIKVYAVCSSYDDDVYEDGRYKDYRVLVPYCDKDGKSACISIQINENMYNEWTNTRTIFCELFGTN